MVSDGSLNLIAYAARGALAPPASARDSASHRHSHAQRLTQPVRPRYLIVGRKHKHTHTHTDGCPFSVRPPDKISTVVVTTADGSIAIALAVLSAREMPDIHAINLRNALRQRFDLQGGSA